MFIRFEVAGQGLWTADWDVAAPRAWRWKKDAERFRGGAWCSRVRVMRPEVREEYMNLRSDLVRGLRSPPAQAYSTEEGRRCITFFRVTGPTAEMIAAGWSLVTLLRKHRWPAYEVFAHKPPGLVTFKDDHQIVVSVRAWERRGAGWDGDRGTIRKSAE